MKKAFRWGLLAFVVGIIGMGVTYQTALFGGGVSADGTPVLTDQAATMFKFGFIFSAVLILISIVLFMFAAAANSK